MNIELTDAEVSVIKQRVMDKLYADLLEKAKIEVHTYVQGGQLISEIRNLTIKQLVADLKVKAMKKLDESQILQRSIQSAEERLNGLLHKNLSAGIVVKFNLSTLEKATGETS